MFSWLFHDFYVGYGIKWISKALSNALPHNSHFKQPQDEGFEDIVWRKKKTFQF